MLYPVFVVAFFRYKGCFSLTLAWWVMRTMNNLKTLLRRNINSVKAWFIEDARVKSRAFLTDPTDTKNRKENKGEILRTMQHCTKHLSSYWKQIDFLLKWMTGELISIYHAIEVSQKQLSQQLLYVYVYTYTHTSREHWPQHYSNMYYFTTT